jgi:hypothetical protein
VDPSKDILMAIHVNTGSYLYRHEYHHITGKMCFDECGIVVARDTQIMDDVQKRLRIHKNEVSWVDDRLVKMWSAFTAKFTSQMLVKP